MEKRVCAREGCNHLLPESIRHNQKYCSTECSTKANNAKILKKYHERRARLKGKMRVCKTPGCGTPLSRYNAGDICGACESRIEESKKRNLRESLGL